MFNGCVVREELVRLQVGEGICVMNKEGKTATTCANAFWPVTSDESVAGESARDGGAAEFCFLDSWCFLVSFSKW